MKSDIILAGVGGQGILSIANVIGIVALKENLNVKQAEVHGMSQRGGAVQSHLRLSTDPISSDLIPEGNADLIISIEPMESLRYLPFLSKTGWLVTNSSTFVNISDYPSEDQLVTEIKKIKNHVIVDADQIARDLGSVRSSNMVILGAAANILDLKTEDYLNSISQIFESKGEKIVEMNCDAFKEGMKASEKYLQSL